MFYNFISWSPGWQFFKILVTFTEGNSFLSLLVKTRWPEWTLYPNPSLGIWCPLYGNTVIDATRDCMTCFGWALYCWLIELAIMLNFNFSSHFLKRMCFWVITYFSGLSDWIDEQLMKTFKNSKFLKVYILLLCLMIRWHSNKSKIEGIYFYN